MQNLPIFITDKTLPVDGQLCVIAVGLEDGSSSVDHLIAEWATAVKNSETGETESFFLLHTPNDNYGDLLTIDQVDGYFQFNGFTRAQTKE